MDKRKSMFDRLDGIPVRWGMTCIRKLATRPYNEEEIFFKLLDKIQPKKVLEIGTNSGVSAAAFAQAVDEVVTFDIVPDPVRKRVWKRLGVEKKITEFVFKSNEQRDWQIFQEMETVDLCFIDGSHQWEDVRHDFEVCLKGGGRLFLFHDYWGKEDHWWPAVTMFVDNLEMDGRFIVEKEIPFALVSEKEK